MLLIPDEKKNKQKTKQKQKTKNNNTTEQNLEMKLLTRKLCQTLSFVHLFYLDWTMAMFYSMEQMTLILHAFSTYKTGQLSSFSLQARKSMLHVPIPFLKQLHWLHVKQRVQFKVLLYVSSVLLTPTQDILQDI